MIPDHFRQLFLLRHHLQLQVDAGTANKHRKSDLAAIEFALIEASNRYPVESEDGEAQFKQILLFRESRRL